MKYLLQQHSKNRKQYKHTKKYSKKNSNARFIRLDKLDNKQYNNFVNLVKKHNNEKIPFLGFWNTKLLNTLINDKKTYVIIQNNNIIGVVIFRNLTFEFKKKILGTENIYKDKNKLSLDSYLFYYRFFNLEIKQSTNSTNSTNPSNKINLEQMNNSKKLEKIYLEDIINIFINNDNLHNKDFILVLLNYFEYNIYTLNITSKYKPIINYMLNESLKYKHLGFIYNGYNLYLHREIIHVFTKRYIRKKITSTDFLPTYIISRQIDNYFAVQLDNIKLLLKEHQLQLLNNVKKFCIHNTLLYYTNFLDNDIYSFTKSIPYDNYFIMNYITNELGNSHLICNYPYLYHSILHFYGKESKEKYNFTEIIELSEDAVKLLDKKKQIILSAFNLYGDLYIKNLYFNDSNKFIKYLNSNESKAFHDGFYIKDMTYNSYLLPIKNNNYYSLTKFILFTFINNEFKTYISQYSGLMVRKYKYEDLFKDKDDKDFKDIDFDSLSSHTYPDEYQQMLINPLDNHDLDILNNKIIENCKIIAKMYRTYVSLECNQIHGYRGIHVYMKPIKKPNNQYDVIVSDTAYYTIFSRRYNYEMSAWIIENTIKPALIPNYKTDKIGTQFQPLDL
jgi:hypothetical protein